MKIDWPSISKILVHKPDHIGDLLCAAPALALIRREAKNAKITAAAMPGAAPFWQVPGLIDEVRPLLGPAWYADLDALSYVRWARAKNFDLLVNFRHDFRDILAMRAFGAKIVCTYDHKGLAKYASFKSNVAEDLCETDNHLGLAGSMGLEAEENYRVESAAADRDFAASTLPADKKCVVFHPFSAAPAKHWPTPRMIETARVLGQKGIAVILVGLKENSAKEIGESCPGLINLVDRTTPGQLLAVVEKADLLVAADSGPGHIGPLVGTPVIALMSGTNEAKRWAPKGATVIREEAPCAPCAKRICDVQGHPCMSGIRPDRVTETVMEMLGR